MRRIVFALTLAVTVVLFQSHPSFAFAADKTTNSDEVTGAFDAGTHSIQPSSLSQPAPSTKAASCSSANPVKEAAVLDGDQRLAVGYCGSTTTADQSAETNVDPCLVALPYISEQPDDQAPTIYAHRTNCR